MISSISAWVLSIAGIICVSVLIELILPNGQMNKYIKGIFSFFVLFVIISPIPKLLNININFSDFLDYGDIQIDEDYIYQLNMDKLASLQEDTQNAIQSQGYENVVVSVDADIFSSTFIVKSATIDLSELVITSQSQHTNITDIKKDITEVVIKILSIEEDKVYFDE